jgi:hypothetical protein
MANILQKTQRQIRLKYFDKKWNIKGEKGRHLNGISFID